MKKRIRLKKKFIIFLSFYAMIFTSYFTITTLAKYVSLSNKNGNIPVAKWDVSVAGEDVTTLPTVTIGDSNTYPVYNLSVTSNSEVAINYSAIITNVPNGVKIQVDNKEDAIYSSSNNTITIENLGRFNAGDNDTHIHKLTIIVPSGIEPFNEQTLNIEVTFTQEEIRQTQ